MPKLTRALFTEAIDGLWLTAQRNFREAGVLHSHMVALDAMARQKLFMPAPEGTPELLQRGIVAVPGPWRDQLDLLGREFKAHRAVAAILIGEAWVGQHEVGLEVVQMGLAPSEHPMSDEMAFVAGVWPREHLAKIEAAVIIRDDKGENPQLADHGPLGGGPDALVAMMSWLNDLLPGPY